MRLVDHAKAHLVVAPIDAVGPLIAAGAVRVDGRVARIADPVGPCSRVEVDADALAAVALRPEPHGLVIHHEDDELLICSKPAPMHVHPLGAYRTGTLLNALLWHCGARPDQPWGAWRPRPLHRLDRGASGLIAIGKTAACHDWFRRDLAAHAIARGYRARVHGRVATDHGTIAAPLGRDPTNDYRRAVTTDGQHAVTHWRVIARSLDTTELAVTLETGRTHQVRAHLASIGHPIVGDALYGSPQSTDAIALHASTLSLRHPTTGVDLTWTSDAF